MGAATRSQPRKMSLVVCMRRCPATTRWPWLLYSLLRTKRSRTDSSASLACRTIASWPVRLQRPAVSAEQPHDLLRDGLLVYSFTDLCTDGLFNEAPTEQMLVVMGTDSRVHRLVVSHALMSSTVSCSSSYARPRVSPGLGLAENSHNQKTSLLVKAKYRVLAMGLAGLMRIQRKVSNG